MMKTIHSLRTYLKEKGWELLTSLIISVAGFFLALYIDSHRERRIEYESYESLIDAIQQEADFNKQVLIHSFEPYYRSKYVAADLSLSTIRASLASSLFVRHADQKTLHTLSEYLRTIELSNGFAASTRIIRTVQGEVDSQMIESWTKNIADCKEMIARVDDLQKGD